MLEIILVKVVFFFIVYFSYFERRRFRRADGWSVLFFIVFLVVRTLFGLERFCLGERGNSCSFYIIFLEVFVVGDGKVIFEDFLLSVVFDFV